nr:hydantoinase B/oxoprolinase family protein [Clostridium sp. AM45-5]
MVGWIANIAHHSDIGGKVPGSTSGDADSLFQEGIRIPVIRIRENNETISSVLDLLLDNTRVPQEREGDLTAQMSANLIGVQRIQEAYARYQDDLIACMKELVGYSERRVRAVVAELRTASITTRTM